MPGTIEHYVGEDVSIPFEIESGDYSSDTLTFIAYDQDGTARISKSTSSGITLSSARAGTISVSRADTSSLQARTLTWWLRRTTSGSNRVLDSGMYLLKHAP